MILSGPGGLGGDLLPNKIAEYGESLIVEGVLPVAYYEIAGIRDRVVNLTPDPDTISTAFNKAGTGGGNASDLIQGTEANQPEIAVVNGLDVLKFTGDKALGMTYTYGTKATWILMTEKDTTAQYIMSGDGVASSPFFITLFNPGTGIEDFEFEIAGGGNSYRRSIQKTATAGLHVLAATHEDSVNARGYFDGVEQYNFTPSGGEDAILSGLDFSFLGGFVTTGGFTGNAPVLLIYPDTLSENSIQRLTNNFQGKYKP